MYNLEKLLYTYKHRKIVMFLAKLYFNDEELLKRLEKHDMDKMFLLLFHDKKDIEGFHRKTSNHHDNDLNKSELDYIEMVLDWESARYTKDDKPLNAYDTLNKYYPHLKEKIMPILKKAGLDYSTFDKNESVVEYAKTFNESSIQDIKDEFINYINEYIPVTKRMSK